MTGRLGVWFMGVLALLPLPVLRGMGWLLEMLANAVVGIVVGGIVVAVVTAIQKMRGKPAAAAH